MAYQGYGRGLEPGWVDEVNDVATGGLRPDATFLLDLPADVGLARIAARGQADRLERADLAFHERVREGFLAIAGGRSRWTVVDATAGEDEVAEAIWATTRTWIGEAESGGSKS